LQHLSLFGQELQLLRLGLRLGLPPGVVELGMERQPGVITHADQAHLPPSLGRHRQGDPFIITVRFAPEFPGTLVDLLSPQIQIAITRSTGSAYYKLSCAGRDIYPSDPYALKRPAETADRLTVVNHCFPRPGRCDTDQNADQNSG
jgi:hypothetical protein